MTAACSGHGPRSDDPHELLHARSVRLAGSPRARICLGSLLILALALAAFEGQRVKGPRFPARGTTGSAMLIDLPVSFIASVDTMKESKDTEGQPLTDAQIVDDVNLS